MKVDASTHFGRDWLLIEYISIKDADIDKLANAFADLMLGEADPDCSSDHACAAKLIKRLVDIHILIPTALGSKRSDLIAKFHGLVHALFMELSMVEELPRYMHEVVTFTTDLGTESGLASLPPDINLAALIPWAMTFDDPSVEEDPLLKEVAESQLSILRRAVLIPGMNHIMHNISGQLSSQLEHYQWWLDRLKPLVGLLNDRSYCDRYLETCLEPRDRALFGPDLKAFSFTIIEWRWGNVAESAHAVSLLRPVLRFWNSRRFMGKPVADADESEQALFCLFK